MTAKNIYKRGKVYYVQATVNGKKIYQTLNTGDQRLAAQRARDIIAAARNSRYDIIDSLKTRRSYAPLQVLCDTYLAGAFVRGLKPATAKSNVAMFNKIINTVRGEGNHTAEILSGDLVQSYIDKQLLAVKGTGIVQDRARRSVYSTLRQARSLFARWTVQSNLYSDLKLPDLHPFLESGSIRNVPIIYALPPADLIQRTMTAGRGLKKSKPEMYAVFLLCHDLGLRASEAMAARFSWIRKLEDRFYIDIIVRDDYRPKGKERSLPVSNDVLEHLHLLPTAGNDMNFILPGDNQTARSNLVKRDFAAWMRSLGWDKHRYPKAAHELRKLIGSRWYTERGAEVAQNWLGHADISTTCRFYATLTRHPEPLDMGGL